MKRGIVYETYYEDRDEIILLLRFIAVTSNHGYQWHPAVLWSIREVRDWTHAATPWHFLTGFLGTSEPRDVHHLGQGHFHVWAISQHLV
jgi:hypothetical protein